MASTSVTPSKSAGRSKLCLRKRTIAVVIAFLCLAAVQLQKVHFTGTVTRRVASRDVHNQLVHNTEKQVTSATAALAAAVEESAVKASAAVLLRAAKEAPAAKEASAVVEEAPAVIKVSVAVEKAPTAAMLRLAAAEASGPAEEASEAAMLRLAAVEASAALEEAPAAATLAAPAEETRILSPPAEVTTAEVVSKAESVTKHGFEHCGAEDSVCKCKGLARYGTGIKWTKSLPVAGSIFCNKIFWKHDPAEGVAKGCYCKPVKSIRLGVLLNKEKERAHATLQNQTKMRVRMHAARKHAREGEMQSNISALQPRHAYQMNKTSIVGSARVLYGIATCSAPGFSQIVDAVFETWGKSLPREQLVIAGGLRDDAADGLVQEVTPCGETKQDFWCKEAVMLWRAAKRVEAVGADWLCVSQEDKYIWTKEVDAELSKHNASVPTVFAAYGCAQHWQYHADSKGGTLPRPAGWPSTFYCDSVSKHGSMCGGPTYFVSRGMLQGLVNGIDSLETFLVAFRTASAPEAATKSSDVLSTCFFYSRMPDGQWRTRGTADGAAILTDRTQGVAIAHIKAGKPDVSVFKQAWFKRTSEPRRSSTPLALHLNHGAMNIRTKLDIPEYMHELHKVDFKALSSAVSVIKDKFEHCSAEHGVCKCKGLVRFGTGNKWTTQLLVSGSFTCNTAFWNHDPAEMLKKSCHCKAGAKFVPITEYGFAHCSAQGGVCKCKGLALFGTGNKWTKQLPVSGNVTCNKAFWKHDPAEGVRKDCYCKVPKAVPVTKDGFEHCGAQGDVCKCKGLARYGTGIKWTKPLPVAGSIFCNRAVWMHDPAVGVPKGCYCKPVKSIRLGVLLNKEKERAHATLQNQTKMQVRTHATRKQAAHKAHQLAAQLRAEGKTAAADMVAKLLEWRQTSSIGQAGFAQIVDAVFETWGKSGKLGVEANEQEKVAKDRLKEVASDVHGIAEMLRLNGHSDLAEMVKQIAKDVKYAREGEMQSNISTLQSRHAYQMNRTSIVGSARVLYGIATCSAPGFAQIVDAVFETWGKSLPREQLVIAGGLRDDAADGLVQEVTPCGETKLDFWCKEAVMLWRAAKRVEAVGADWLCVSQEDKYIWTKEVDAELSKHNASVPTVFAAYGCAQQSKYSPVSQSWEYTPTVVGDYCDSVSKHGSICGGQTYFVSRGMLRGLVNGIESLEAFVVAFRTSSVLQASTHASDVMSTCFFYSRMPDGQWRTKGFTDGTSSIDHKKAGKPDVSVFVEAWLKSHTTPPLAMHLNHGAMDVGTKLDIPEYMHELHKVDFKALSKVVTSKATEDGFEHCSAEHGVCKCQGMARYGTGIKWTKGLPVAGNVTCNKDFWKHDPAENLNKSCYCKPVKIARLVVLLENELQIEESRLNQTLN